jgi:hypothetical protein
VARRELYLNLQLHLPKSASNRVTGDRFNNSAQEHGYSTVASERHARAQRKTLPPILFPCCVHGIRFTSLLDQSSLQRRQEEKGRAQTAATPAVHDWTAERRSRSAGLWSLPSAPIPHATRFHVCLFFSPSERCEV